MDTNDTQKTPEILIIEKKDSKLREIGSIILIAIFLGILLLGTTLWGIHSSYGQSKYSYLETVEIPDKENDYTEVIAKRTENTQTFTNGIDSYVKVYVGDKFVSKDGALLPFIDNSQIVTEKPVTFDIPSKSASIIDIINIFDTKTAWATLSATVAVNSGKDSGIVSSVPTNNYGTSTQRSVEEKPAGAESSRLLIGADLPAQPTASATITKIELKAYKIDNSGCTNDTSLYNQAHMITQQAWTESGVTWNKYNAASNWGTAGGDYEATYLYRNAVGTDTGVWRTWTLYGTGSNHDYDNPTWGTTLSVILKFSSTTPASDTCETFALKEHATSTLRPYFIVYYNYPEPTAPPAEPTGLSTESVPLLRGINVSLILLLVIGVFDLMRRIFIKR